MHKNIPSKLLTQHVRRGGAYSPSSESGPSLFLLRRIVPGERLQDIPRVCRCMVLASITPSAPISVARTGFCNHWEVSNRVGADGARVELPTSQETALVALALGEREQNKKEKLRKPNRRKQGTRLRPRTL